ncbi:hypothetical protein BMS3Bbin08_02676 [bacterium BMS3Bbin08]|nr:hypothetical protein BMS3Bbin08_02676 [bacterium BMS3Bbin08]
MTTIYLDHNIIDKFDKGETAYLEPVFANKEYLPIISVVSIDEIFRGGEQARSRRNIESLQKLGVRYIHSGPDESHMLIDELDYENMHQKWLGMQSDIGPLNNSFFLFISTLFSENETEAFQNMERAITDEISWVKNNFDKFPNLQEQMREILKNPEEYMQLCKQLIALKRQLPFTSREINNIPEHLVFWTCVDKLKNAADANLQLIADEIKNAIDNKKTIDDQFMIVSQWLNLFGYYPDKLTRIEKIKSNFSDARHGTYGIACDGILTLDKRFTKRITAAMSALRLETIVGTDANELIHRIALRTGTSSVGQRAGDCLR